MDVTNHAHSNSVLRELNELRGRAELTDVVLEVEGRSFPCHRAVLASCSPYFRTMFTSGYAEAKQERISIQDVSEVAMATILDYAYTGCLRTEPDQVQAVMSAARLLQLDFVGRKTAEYMKDRLDVSNCVDVLMYADMLADCGLVKASKRYMASRFDQVAIQPSFVQLPLNHLQSLLDRDDLMTNLEDNVVQAALRWVDFNQEDRLQHLSTLCKSLRQSLISSKLCAEIESKLLSIDSTLVYSDSTTQRLGQVRTELQIFLRQAISKDDSAPCYDPSTGRLYAMNMPENLDSFSRSVTVTCDGELYLAGDIVTKRETGMYDKQKKFYQYNHLLNTWEPRRGMTTPRARCGLVYLNGYIYALGGDDTKETAERYDPSSDEWTSIPPIPHPVSSEVSGMTLNDSIYALSKEGCYCFNTTENKWSKIADMLQKMHPQAVTYQGCIYCIDSNDDCGSNSSRYVEMYNPETDEWKRTGPFFFDTATLMTYGKTLYLLTVHNGDDADEREVDRTTLVIRQYQPKTDSWLLLREGRPVPPLARWLNLSCSTDCLTVRMIQSFLGNTKAYKRDYRGVGRRRDGSYRGGSSDSSDSDDLSDQEDSDEDDSDEDRQSGTDD
ncbi:kelch repeat and BTB domain-containing protein 8-like [Branchiostoma floridae]|uniref:Kelch repeat and BTB domain-containing protein 8-like n=2 Tax=Branchiostoma floridae TaxID=7739 RepID=A0A9J7MMZ6_BRAFL|nr:kelch repeat and BTB domain-containing protein 8-like [Branchiostoma floridae]